MWGIMRAEWTLPNQKTEDRYQRAEVLRQGGGSDRVRHHYPVVKKVFAVLILFKFVQTPYIKYPPASLPIDRKVFASLMLS